MAKVESPVEAGEIQGQEVFLFIDNSTFKSTYYQGYSKSRKLSGIILRLYQAIRDRALILHVIHMTGTRMKALGVDGLSRVDLLEGMMAGDDPLSFAPLARGADKRTNGKVGKQIMSWWKDTEGGSLGWTFP